MQQDAPEISCKMGIFMTLQFLLYIIVTCTGTLQLHTEHETIVDHKQWGAGGDITPPTVVGNLQSLTKTERRT